MFLGPRATAGALATAIVLAIVAAMSTASAASARSWSRVSLPAGIGSLDGISCVAQKGGGQCVAVGQNTSGAGAVVLTSDDGGARWTREAPPAGVAGLFGVSCASALRCWAVGEADTKGNRAAIVGSGNGGRSWSLEAAPMLAGRYPAAALQKVSCIGERCVAAGIRNGGFVLVSGDGGRRWSAHGLPQGCRGFCRAYSATAVTLASAQVAYAGGGNQCGGAHVTQCPGVLWKSTNGGGSWKIVFKGYPFVDAISCADTSHCWPPRRRSRPARSSAAPTAAGAGDSRPCRASVASSTP